MLGWSYFTTLLRVSRSTEYKYEWEMIFVSKQVKRKRDIPIFFRASESERKLITENMKRAKINNMGAYLRKIAIDGYVVNLDLTEVRELVSLLRNVSHNINQIARRANETRSIYEADIKDLQARYDGLWGKADEILRSLADLRSAM